MPKNASADQYINDIYGYTFHPPRFINECLMSRFIKTILNTKKNIDLYRKIYFEHKEQSINKFWNIYCDGNIDKPCSIPNDINTDSLNVLKKILQNDEFLKILQILDVNSIYKKYIKYKTKYTSLKNNK